MYDASYILIFIMHYQVTSVLWANGAVVGAVTALLAEVDVGSDAAL